MKFFTSLTNAIKEILSDERGQLSSKRIVGVAAAFSIIIALLFSWNPSGDIVNAVTLLAIAGLGLTTIDKFSFKQKND